MPIPPLQLDDRTFADLVDELRSLMPRRAPAWTNHNAADPGIMLVELFAWATEAMIYRINRVPPVSRARFLELLGARFQPARPAVVRVKVTTQDLTSPYRLKRGTVLYAQTERRAPRVAFETVQDYWLTPSSPAVVVTARQSELVEGQLLGQSNGQSHQLLMLGQPSILLPSEPFPRRPIVMVGDERWEYRATLRDSGPDDIHFTIRPWLNAVVFGDGCHGRQPADDAPIRVTYRTEQPTLRVVENELVRDTSRKAARVFRLRHPLFALDLQEEDPFEPALYVTNQGPKQRWAYRSSFLDLGVGAAEFTVEPWSNAIRLGDGGGHGQIAQGEIRASYRHTLGAAGNLPRAATFLLDPKLEGTRPRLTVDPTFRPITPGVDRTGLDEARDMAFTLLKPHERAITGADFQELTAQNHADIVRVTPVSGRDLTSETPDAYRPGHVSAILTPRARYELAQPVTLLGEPYAISPDGQRLVTLVEAEVPPGKVLRLWNMVGGAQVEGFSVGSVTRAHFSPDSRRLVTSSEGGLAHLWDAERGELVCNFGNLVDFAFSPTGHRLFTRHTGQTATLWDTDGGLVVASLTAPAAVETALFSPTSDWLATTHSDRTVRLWNTADGALNATLRHAHDVRRVFFGPNGQLLATLDDSGTVYLWRQRFVAAGDASPAHRWGGEQGEPDATFPHNTPVVGMQFSPDGTRLVTWGGAVELWSTRSRQKLASLAGSGFAQVEPAHVCFDPTGRLLAMASRPQEGAEQGAVRLWNARSGEPVGELAHDAPIQTLLFGGDGERLMAIDEAHHLHLWGLVFRRGQPLVVDVSSLLLLDELDEAWLNADGNWLATLKANLLTVWGPGRGRAQSVFYHHHTHASVRSLTPNVVEGGLLATWSDSAEGSNLQRVVRVWHAGHVEDAEALLASRGLITSHHHVAGVGYTDVCITATVVRNATRTDSRGLQRAICAALHAFFHPLQGGPEQTGWPLARPVYASEVYQIVEGVEGVDHVAALHIAPCDAPGWQASGSLARIDLPAHHLVNLRAEPDHFTIALPGAEE